MQVSATFETKSPIVLTPTALKQLDEIVTGFADEHEYVAACADHLERRFDDAKGLGEFVNPPRQAIHRVRVEARYRLAGDNLGSLRLSLGARGRTNVDLYASGSQERVTKLVGRFQDWLGGVRPWWAVAARVDLVWIALCLFGCVWVLASLLLLVMGPSAGGTRPATIDATSGTAIVLGAFALIAGLDWLRARLFPLSTFALGQGERRHRHLEMLRVGVLLPVLVTICYEVAKWCLGLT